MVIAKRNPFSFKFARAILAPVVYQIVALAEVLAMGDDHALVEHIVEIACHPPHLVGPCRRILSRSCGEDVQVEMLLQRMHGFDGSRHGLHLGKESGNLIQASLVFLLRVIRLKV